jgi:hypothetical protein
MNTNTQKIIDAIKAQKPRSAWNRGVKAYALELAESLDWFFETGELTKDDLKKAHRLTLGMLNGADSWEDFSWGGCSLIYNADIAERLCTRSELMRNDFGRRDPGGFEKWLDVQGRALDQASWLVVEAADKIA